MELSDPEQSRFSLGLSPLSADVPVLSLAYDGPDLKRLRAALAQTRVTLRQGFQNGFPVAELMRAHADWIDSLLIHAWVGIQPTARNPNAALIAVGGYGRRELHPCSDIDLLILLEEPNQNELTPAIERFLTLLWDIGLEVGHSVRSLADCVSEARRDIGVMTNLMEARLITGSVDRMDALRAELAPDRLWPVRDFFSVKCQEQLNRHRKFHDSAYRLEPNIKESRGGLRDIQTIAWVAKRHFATDTLHDLVTHRLLTEAEYESLRVGQDFLWYIRYALHLLTGRREDRLLFDYQGNLAQQFGYTNDGHILAVEQFMMRYYRTVMELSRLNEMLLQLFQEAIIYDVATDVVVPINKRFQMRNDFIEVTYPTVFQHYPFALLEMFLLLAQHPELRGVRAATIRLVRDHRYLIDDSFRADLRCRALFMELLRQPHGVTQELWRMNRYGVLAAYLPVFGKIVGQMQHDLFHIYTVDEHTLVIVGNLRRFSLARHAEESPLCSELFQTLPKPEILYLAGLFHDIAKGRGGDHSDLGAEDALAFCLHHGMSQYDARFVAWLVKQHLVMSSTAQRQDISDADVINGFAGLVSDQVHLNYLYLLTVADIRATNPVLWNSWKDALLRELYLATKRALRRGLENPIDKQERINDTQNQAREILRQTFSDDMALAKLWADLEDDYFLRHSVDEIAWHAQVILSATLKDLPLVSIRRRTQRGGTEIFLYTHDQDHLFAAATTALDQLGLTVVDARIITARSGFTLDTYIVLEGSGEPISGTQRISELSTALKQQLSCPTVGQVTRRVRRLIKHFSQPTEIIFRPDERNQRTIMEVITTDRPGLLSAVAKTFQQWGIRLQNAKIATFGARVEDIFFITTSDNQPIYEEAHLASIRETLIDQLDKPG